MALVVGHSKCFSEGAMNEKTGLTEWIFNKNVVSALQLMSWPDDVEILVFERPPTPRGLHDVVVEVNAYDPDLAFSFHANASGSGLASGTEVLYWYRSMIGKKVAQIAQKALVDCLGLPDRGTKPIAHGERGSYFLRKVYSPAIIFEPFFIDNDRDLLTALSKFSDLVVTYQKIIKEAINEIQSVF
ncbi:MAG: N-acetylmuramoyl-L-alanine amidase [Thermotogae bacterium]|nr:N-acetylmuramoyl-L-alanine amidase [Thermotogota bacterium]